MSAGPLINSLLFIDKYARGGRPFFNFDEWDEPGDLLPGWVYWTPAGWAAGVFETGMYAGSAAAEGYEFFNPTIMQNLQAHKEKNVVIKGAPITKWLTIPHEWLDKWEYIWNTLEVEARHDVEALIQQQDEGQAVPDEIIERIELVRTLAEINSEICRLVEAAKKRSSIEEAAPEFDEIERLWQKQIILIKGGA